MEMILLYYALLALWVPLLWPALRLRGWKRGALLVIVLGGVLATASEIWQAYGASNAIRLDILLFSVVLIMLYAAAVAVLLIARWRTAATLLGAVLVLVAGTMAYNWALIAEESREVQAKLDERDQLLFDAKFRDRAAYDAFFGPFGGLAGSYPAGHWKGEAGSPYTRLVVNGIGDAWLFYRCGAAECAYRPSNRALERVVDGAAREWRGLLRPLAGELLSVRIVQENEERLTLEARGQKVAFAKASPPLATEPRHDMLSYLGSFVSSACIRKHAAVRQLWLWGQGERLFAVGVFQTLVAGQRALFVSPFVLGEGRRAGDAWIFEWQREGQAWKASVELGVDSVSLVLTRPGQKVESAVLEPGAIFSDETVDLAPRDSAEAWQHWFDTVWVGHFFSGTIPACT